MEATSVSVATPYPARLEGHLERPSRWLWLVKWLLALPHYIVLAFLWLAFAVLSVIAFVAILFTGRYPRGIFDFNVGVMRWTWRVSFYAFAANGTDRYPPFTLADVPDYPARLAVAYPAWQRTGLPLIGWWLAGIPQYLVAGVFAGGGGAMGWEMSTHGSMRLGWPGLIGLLVFFGVVVLLFRGTYPRGIFDFVLGLNRWVLRVSAYAALMTPEYPPWRLDGGEIDTAGLVVPAALSAQEPAAPTAEARRWSGGRVLAVVLGSVAVLAALAALAGGTVAVVFDQTQRDAAGFLMTGRTAYATDTYALVSDSYRTGAADEPLLARRLLGDVRIAARSTSPVFVGIGPAANVDRYLAGVRREVATDFGARPSDFRLRGAAAPSTPPGAQPFWASEVTGIGEQTLTWTPRAGDWRVVLMNSDGSAGVRATMSAGAELPQLLWIGLAALVGGGLLLIVGAGAIYAAVPRAPRRIERTR
jgi:hypothetical protein